jgi:hypothetical protein
VHIKLLLQLPLFAAFKEHPIQLYVHSPLKVSEVSAHDLVWILDDRGVLSFNATNINFELRLTFGCFQEHHIVFIGQANGQLQRTLLVSPHMQRTADVKPYS